MGKTSNIRTLYLLLLIALFAACKTPQPANHTRGKKPIAHSHTNNNNSETDFYKTYSAKLNIKLSGSEDKKLITCLASWLGTPYKYGGNTKQGTDCSGLVLQVYKEVYNKDMYRSSADQLKNVTQIARSELQAGDLLFFKISGENISHVGIYIGENKFIHASTKRGVVINSLDEDYYKKYFFVAGRVIMK